MQSISVYMNQVASGAGGKKWVDAIQRHLFRSEINYRRPRTLEELDSQILEDLQKDVDAFVCVGGDGTVNTLIQYLADKNKGLLVVPGGTANDLACELGHQKNLSKVIHCIRHNDLRDIDLLSVNGRYMATNGGIGIGADVASKINNLRNKYPLFKQFMKFSGKKVYSFFLASEFLNVDFPQYDLELSSKEFSGQIKASIVMVNNQPVLGGTFPVAPKTRNDDGRFNVSILKHQTRVGLLNCIYRITSRQSLEHDENFIQFETSSLNIKNRSARRLPFFGDGETFDSQNEYQIDICSNALKLYRCGRENPLDDCPPEVFLS